ncbi:hypothetical protein BDZ89DRAFT_990450 [Hymenopellis radicata]|nr:hypothetical protein BDZ89DRAFT_990450 [Hymenopellis radicata]
MPPKDGLLREQYADTYPQHIWFFLTSLIALISLCQLISFLLGQVTKSPTGGGSKRIPVAAVNTYRALTFRTTVRVGSYSLNAAKVACAMIYIVVLFSGVHSKCSVLFNPHLGLSVGYMSNRAGAIAVSQFPLIAVLGTKNNVRSFLAI